jgi:DNA (cytosine-5)-methyltransferase 1
MRSKLTVGSLFSGIGGLDLGLERAGMQVLWQCEIDPYCRRVLEKHWPGVTRYDDIREITGDEVGYTDVLAGGFPCQDVSTAGKRAGIAEGTRSGLWFEFARLIGEIKPRWVIIENVPGLLSVDSGRGMGTVLYDLAVRGYDAEWDCISAASVGALHRRDRIFIVAHANGSGHLHGQAGKLPAEAGEHALGEPIASCEDVADADAAGLEGQRPEYRLFPEGGPCPRIASGGWWTTEPDVGRVAHGIPARVDRLRALGNAVVPQVAEYIGRCIMRAEEVTP